MQITINGTVETVEDGTTLMALLESKKIPVPGTAIAMNGALIQRVRFSETIIPPQADIDIVRAIGGG